MKITLIVLVSVMAAGVAAYVLLFPSGTFLSVRRPGGNAFLFARTSISFERAPDHYGTNGMDHLEPYASRLLAPSNNFKSLHMFTPDGDRGFALDSHDVAHQASFAVEWRHDPKREAAIRSFFNAVDTGPAQDYLASNGRVPDATRILEYPIRGSAPEITALARRILQELCGASPTEALNIKYKGK